MASSKGRYTRRHDRNGNAYFIDRETGKRVSRDAWQRERDRIARRRERESEEKRKPAQKPPVSPPKRRAPPPSAPAAPPAAPPTPAPFPPGVEEPGFPVDDFGEWDDAAFEIEGEDDTG